MKEEGRRLGETFTGGGVMVKLRYPGLIIFFSAFVHLELKLLLPFEHPLSSSSTLFGAKRKIAPSPGLSLAGAIIYLLEAG